MKFIYYVYTHTTTHDETNQTVHEPPRAHNPHNYMSQAHSGTMRTCNKDRQLSYKAKTRGTVTQESTSTSELVNYTKYVFAVIMREKSQQYTQRQKRLKNSNIFTYILITAIKEYV